MEQRSYFEILWTISPYMPQKHSSLYIYAYLLILLLTHTVWLTSTCKKGMGLVNYVYKLCTVWSNSILSHDTLHQRLSSNNGLENGDRELRHFFYCYKSCKNYTWWLCTLHNRYFKSALFEIWLRHSANCVPVGHACMCINHLTKHVAHIIKFHCGRYTMVLTRYALTCLLECIHCCWIWHLRIPLAD